MSHEENAGTLTNKTILVTGYSGLLGSEFCKFIDKFNHYAGLNISLILLSRNKKDLKLSDTSVSYYECDIKDPSFVDLIDADSVDYIINFASNTCPAQYSANPVGTIETNVLGLLNLIEITKKNPNIKLINMSSVEYYGTRESDEPWKEEDSGYIDCRDSRSCYNESKRLQESLCAAAAVEYGLNYNTIRLSRCFGPTLLKTDNKAMTQFLMKGRNKEDIVLKSEGNQIFDYIYSKDAIQAILKVMSFAPAGETYNVSAQSIRLKDLAKLIAEIYGVKVTFDLSNQSGASKATVAIMDTSKIRKELDWSPEFTIESGVKNMIRTNPSEWSPKR